MSIGFDEYLSYSIKGGFSGVTIKAQFLNFNARNWAFLYLLIVQNSV